MNSNNPKGITTAVLGTSCSGQESGGTPSTNPARRRFGTCQPGSEITHVGTGVSVRLRLHVEIPKTPQGLQDPSAFFTMCSGDTQLLLEQQMTPCRSISLNSALAALSLAGSWRLYLTATGLSVISMWCWTLWMTSGRSFVALNTTGNPDANLTPKCKCFLLCSLQVVCLQEEKEGPLAPKLTVKIFLLSFTYIHLGPGYYFPGLHSITSLLHTVIKYVLSPFAITLNLWNYFYPFIIGKTPVFFFF